MKSEEAKPILIRRPGIWCDALTDLAERRQHDRPLVTADRGVAASTPARVYCMLPTKTGTARGGHETHGSLVYLGSGVLEVMCELALGSISALNKSSAVMAVQRSIVSIPSDTIQGLQSAGTVLELSGVDMAFPQIPLGHTASPHRPAHVLSNLVGGCSIHTYTPASISQKGSEPGPFLPIYPILPTRVISSPCTGALLRYFISNLDDIIGDES